MEDTKNVMEEIEKYLQKAEDEIASAISSAEEYEKERKHSLHRSASDSDKLNAVLENLPESLTKPTRRSWSCRQFNGKGWHSPKEKRVPYKLYRNAISRYDGRVDSIIKDARLQRWSQELLKEFLVFVEEEIKLLSNLPESFPYKEPNNNMGASHSNAYEGWVDDYSLFRTYTLPRSSQRSVSLTGDTAISLHPDDKSEQCKLLKITKHRLSRSFSLEENRESSSVYTLDNKELSPWAKQNLKIIDEAHTKNAYSNLHSKLNKEEIEAKKIKGNIEDSKIEHVDNGAKFIKNNIKNGKISQNREIISSSKSEPILGMESLHALDEEESNIKVSQICKKENNLEILEKYVEEDSFLERIENHNGNENFINFSKENHTNGDNSKKENESQELGVSNTIVSQSALKESVDAENNIDTLTVESLQGYIDNWKWVDEDCNSEIKCVCSQTKEKDLKETSRELNELEKSTGSSTITENLDLQTNNLTISNYLDTSDSNTISDTSLITECNGIGSIKPSLSPILIRTFNDSTDNSSLNLSQVPVFNSSLWDTLPPADEMEVMENKPLQQQDSYSSYASREREDSFNSSLSSLSQLSLQDDFSEHELSKCYSDSNLSDTGFCTEDLSPDVFLDPNQMSTPKLSTKEQISNDVDQSDCSLVSSSKNPECDIPEPIKGILHLKPVSSALAEGNHIAVSVSISKYPGEDSEYIQISEDAPIKLISLDKVESSLPQTKVHSGENIPISRKDFRVYTTDSTNEEIPDTSHFLREVEIRIPKPPISSPRARPTDLGFFLSSENFLLSNASTQTSPMQSPGAYSSYSYKWSNDYPCDTYSLEPRTSSMAVSSTEDDFDDHIKGNWSADSLTSSPPQTPISPMRDDSSLSLSESLDYVEPNFESGIGTASTRPSESPVMASLDLSGSNLSSEDASFESSYGRRSRRYMPNSRRYRISEHSSYYVKKKQRLIQAEQWVRRENQTTQTDFNVQTPESEILPALRKMRASSEEASASRRLSSEKIVRQTSSEPKLSSKLYGYSIANGLSETNLPPIPDQHLSEQSLPVVKENRKGIQRPNHLPLMNKAEPSSKTCSSSKLEVRMRRKYIRNHTANQTANFTNTGVLPVKNFSAKDLSEIEALEACKWLRAAGFPQYSQMYEDFQFPLDLLSVERDHSFLDRDSLLALFRRLKILNRCARIRLDSTKAAKPDDSDEEDQECALSQNWEFEVESRRWSRIDPDQINTGRHEHKRPDSERVRSCSDGADEPAINNFKRSGSERLRDGAKAILRRMESLKSKKKRKRREGLVIGSPKVLDEMHMRSRMAELGCVDISPDPSPVVPFKDAFSMNKKHSKENKPSTEDSSSLTSDQSLTSTPMFKTRRRRKLWSNRTRPGEPTGAYSDSECSPPTWRNKSVTLHRQPHHKSSNVPKENCILTESKIRPELRHATSLTYGKDSQRARESFLSSLQAKKPKSRKELCVDNASNSRRSIYDNVPLIICNKAYHDYYSGDVDMVNRDGSGSSECTMESRGSPFPSTQDDEDTDDKASRRSTLDRWHSFNKKTTFPPYAQLDNSISGFSVGQMNLLRKRALLRLTAIMERHCPTNRTTWNWELPKFIRKIKSPDYKERNIFGVPLQVLSQRTGQPLPVKILQALSYLREHCLDQLGIFRKPGVRTRIQRLRDQVEAADEISYDDYTPCDIADLVKTYFRELPEVLLTTKLSQIYIAIFMYIPEDLRLEALQCIMLMMPDVNREALMTLLTFLSDVAENSHLNQMTAANLAVCLAPSLFHFNIGVSSSPLRKRAMGTPEQKDLHDNKAAHQCLTVMIQQVTRLKLVPIEMISNCRFSYLDYSQPVALEELGTKSGSLNGEGDWTSYMNACISALYKEAREKNRGWINISYQDTQVEMVYRKVGDGHPLRLWKITTEVEAPPTELLTRIMRERHLWDNSLCKWRVVAKLNKQAEIFQYIVTSMPPRPAVDFCVLRSWKTDFARKMCVVVETSVEYNECPSINGCLRGIVLASRYLIQPCGSGKSRVTHMSRIDFRGRRSEWYNKVYPHIAASRIVNLRNSFSHNASGPESKV